MIVGHVDSLELRGGTAHLTLAILDHVQLPRDSVASLKSEGMLGDKSVRVVPGVATELLAEGDSLTVGDLPPDLEKVIRQVNDIAGDVKVITANVRALTEDETTKQELLLTIQNIRVLSEQLSAIAAANSDDVAAITANLKDVSAALKVVLERTGEDVDEEMAAVKTATAKLDASLAHIESITAGIERGRARWGSS